MKYPGIISDDNTSLQELDRFDTASRAIFVKFINEINSKVFRIGEAKNSEEIYLYFKILDMNGLIDSRLRR